VSDLSYWLRQDSSKPLFPDIEWSKPEQKAQRGRLGIIGGNKLGFAAVAENYQKALKSGAGEVKVLLPDGLKKQIPPTMVDVVFGATTPSGSLSRDALNEMKALGQWATGILLIGDAGRNSETAVLYENFIMEYKGPLTITRDAIDLIKNNATSIVDRPDTLLVASFAQLQKIFQYVYYPKVLTFSMQLTNLVEAIHKFTITYPVSIVTFHQDNIVIASDGKVITTLFSEPLKIWRGEVATRAATYWLWSPSKTIESVATSLIWRPNA